MVTVASLWRYPIKSHGRETMASTPLITGKTIPWDRHWAVTHGDTKFDHDNPTWIGCRNFMIGTATPSLAGMSATFDQQSETITLRHVELGKVTFRPSDPADVKRFITWVSPICPPDKRQPTGIVSAPDRGMTDTPTATVSIMNLASHDAVALQAENPLQMERWRGNIWVDGADAWAEWDWIGKTVQIGDAKLRVIDPVQRCKHTEANTTTGTRDIDTLSILRDGWDHQNFGVYAEVIQDGTVHLGDTLKVE